MPYIPHTEAEIKAMLARIGVSDIQALFGEIPASLRSSLTEVPAGLSEMQISQLMRQRAAMDEYDLCFAGAGAYDHHIPAAVWELTTRGEFYSAYTPYQAEASQGTLQLLYEYQSMMSSLMGMDVSNASLYDGATSLAEAVLMTIRCLRKGGSRKILMPDTVHPHYRQVTQTIVENQGIELVPVPFGADGRTDLNGITEGDYAALVIPQPNFFGVLEDTEAMMQWAADHGAMTIALVNPMAMSLLKPPGQWGESGVDIACGDGQPLGIPLSSGGPYFGFLCCRQNWVRQLPGRLVGRTVDQDGKTGFALTLQAREQHIRRSKATSNICTNQGLLVTAATIYMAIMGFEGIRQNAASCHRNTVALKGMLEDAGLKPKFADTPVFHELVYELPVRVQTITDKLAAEKIVAGFDLSGHFAQIENGLLVCATETKTTADLERFAVALKKSLG